MKQISLCASALMASGCGHSDLEGLVESYYEKG